MKEMGVEEGRQRGEEESETGVRKRETSRRVDGAELTSSRARTSTQRAAPAMLNQFVSFRSLRLPSGCALL
jgi:hypothetical protein